jgi:hypothetical protein
VCSSCLAAGDDFASEFSVKGKKWVLMQNYPGCW